VLSFEHKDKIKMNFLHSVVRFFVSIADKFYKFDIMGWRFEYYRIVEDIEEREGIVLGVDEFEEGFVSFLIEKKGVEPGLGYRV
jgi:hypothetical protein